MARATLDATAEGGGEGVYDLDRVGAAVPRLHLAAIGSGKSGGGSSGEGSSGGSGGTTQPHGSAVMRHSAASMIASCSLSEGDSALLSASCTLWCGATVYAKGWLVVTQAAITFICFSHAQAAAALAANAAHGRVTSSPPPSASPTLPVPVTELPLPLADVDSVATGVHPGEIVITCRGGSHTMVFASLRAPDATISRISAVLHSRDAMGKAADTLKVVRQYLAGKAGRAWLQRTRSKKSALPASTAADGGSGGQSSDRDVAATRLQSLHRARLARRHAAAAAAAAFTSAATKAAAQGTGPAGPQSVASIASLRLPRVMSAELVEASRLGEVAAATRLLTVGRADPDSFDWRGMSAVHVRNTALTFRTMLQPTRSPFILPQWASDLSQTVRDHLSHAIRSAAPPTAQPPWLSSPSS